MSDFFYAKLAPSILSNEGGYANNPSDPGGETMWGITKRVAVANGYVDAMRAMPKSTALEIYKMEYWTKPGFAALAEASPIVAKELFDCGVNMGVTVAGSFLQTALNAFNARGKLYPDVAVDGRPGAQTLAALRLYLAKRGAAAETVLMRALVSQRGARYLSLASKPSNEDFEYGWFANRVQGRYDAA
jgi:lysozyme family protein